MSQLETQTKAITAQIILTRLEQKVSLNNAKLLLDSAKTSNGFMKIENGTELTSEQAKSLCLTLINQGGPAFHVGQAIYKEYLM